METKEHTMETVFVLIAKDLATDRCWVEDVYSARDLAEAEMEAQMELWEESRAYKIDSVPVTG
jgi:hypothetical protein